MEVEFGGCVGRQDWAATFLHVLSQRRHYQVADGGFRRHQQLHWREASLHGYLQQHLRRLSPWTIRRRSGYASKGWEIGNCLRTAELSDGHGGLGVERGRSSPPVTLILRVTAALGGCHGTNLTG